MDWPNQLVLPYGDIVITPISSCGAGMGIAAATPSSAAWPTANTAYYIPFRIPHGMIVANMFIINGATINGNLDIGIYSTDGTRLISSGSTAHAGANIIQTVAISITLGAGLFYMALAFDGNTATVGYCGLGHARWTRCAGIVQQANAFVLPATATFATCTTSVAWQMGLTGRSFI